MGMNPAPLNWSPLLFRIPAEPVYLRAIISFRPPLLSGVCTPLIRSLPKLGKALLGGYLPGRYWASGNILYKLK